jgi:lipopolysaccharide/colanic/teichoic acid biosynthesis glycosyltransferase
MSGVEDTIPSYGLAVDEVAAPSSSSDRPLYFAAKRFLDVLVAGVLLLVLAPLLLLVALAITLETPGRVLFSQQRAGSRRRTEGGKAIWEARVFRIYKFRTMVQSADSVLHEAHIKAFVAGRIDQGDGAAATFKLRSDPRVTRVGRFLRKTSIDELPQLVNVLVGQMSLVGPRPVPLYEAELYRPWERERFSALPGVTGLWQVNGRCELSFDEMIRLDVEYVRRRSLALDVSILVRTIPAVLSMRGAG